MMNPVWGASLQVRTPTLMPDAACPGAMDTLNATAADAIVKASVLVITNLLWIRACALRASSHVRSTALKTPVREIPFRTEQC
jgi:hypothetical protein